MCVCVCVFVCVCVCARVCACVYNTCPGPETHTHTHTHTHAHTSTHKHTLTATCHIHRESVDQLAQQQTSARVQAERTADDIRDRQQRHSSVSGSLDERVQTLEGKLAEASETIEALRNKEAQESRRHSKALAEATETMAQVISRVKQVEERVVPDVQRYVDKSNEEFWGPSQTEINALRSRVEELGARIDQVDSTASSLIVSERDTAAKDRLAARDERIAQVCPH